MAIIIHYYLVIHHVYQSLNEYHKMFIFNQSFALNKPLNIENLFVMKRNISSFGI